MNLTSIAFIPDGNRRYVKEHNLPIWQAHQIGTQKAWEVLDWLIKYPKIKVGTFWAMSMENFKERAPPEKAILFKILGDELDKVKEGSIFETHELKLKFVGKLDILPKEIREKVARAEKFTENFKAKTVNLAIAYSGREEIVSAAKKLAEDYKGGAIDIDLVDENSFKKYLYMNSNEPELIIRTGGRPRMSSFLTYQSVYSELYFTEKLWPEFSEQDLDNAVGYFNSIQRNCGK